jgi:N-acetylglutamate synthase-like GNAT family acetyltransferase
MTITRKAHPEEFKQVVDFYRDNGYAPVISPSDIIVVAEKDHALCGALRLCEEQNTLVLCGMRVCKSMQRQGVGTLLLQAAEKIIGERECFCIPLRYLEAFYGRIGFAKIEATDAPPFLQDRCAEYRRVHGLNVIVMQRPKEAGT